MTRQEKIIRENLLASEDLISCMREDKVLIKSAARLVQTLIESLDQGGKILFFGNGGSATDSAHLAAEFIGSPMTRRNPLPAISLATDISIITAISNDYGYAEVFSRQIKALGNAGDIAIGLSTSGQSPNVIAGLRAARAGGLVTVAMTGDSPGPAEEISDMLISIPCSNTDRVQMGHMLIGHHLCQAIERHFSGV